MRTIDTDKYFTKTNQVVSDHGDVLVTYGVFLRRPVICAINKAIEFLESNVSCTVTRHYAEGAFVPAEKPLFSYSGSLAELVQIETELLQHVGIACVSAYNAFKMAQTLPNVSFIDMHARHAPGQDCTRLAAYGASTGSRMAKMLGAKGFIGSSLDSTAKYYDTPAGLGTMPHVLVGYAGSTLESVKMYMRSHQNDNFVVALVDYFGKEVTDAIEVGTWFMNQPENSDKTLGIRLDTHGGRWCEGLDYNKSVDVVSEWLHTDGEWATVEAVMGADVYDRVSDAEKDKYRRILFGAGVSAANIIHMRNTLNKNGLKNVILVASSGFDLFKCDVMARVRAPIDVVGTGSFIPKTFSETFATADVYRYNNVFSVKVGREKIFQHLR